MAYSAARKREYQNAWIQKRRQEWLDENGPCQTCGSNENLTVDHIDRKTKRYAVSSVWSLSKTNPIRVLELSKCQVLCYDCHRAKTNKEESEAKTKPLVHGTANAYVKKGCRCEPCRNWRYEKWLRIG